MGLGYTPRVMSTPLRFAPAPESGAALSALARGVRGSVILKIAAEIRAMKARGAAVCNLTVGDFDPAYFPIPETLDEEIRRALSDGQTNYPASDGILPLREAIAEYYHRELGVDYPVDGILVAAGARPLLYGIYRTLLDHGDTVIYPVPSWNNDHYVHLSGARAVEIPVHASTNFFPTAELLAPHIGNARLLVLNSPANPTGTVIDPEELRKVGELVLAENRHRAWRGRRPLYLAFDQVYWTLTFGSAVHATPVGLLPDLAPYTILLDAISKSFCATGLRVGWGLMPPVVRSRMADILGHVGTWAPKPEQVATAALLGRAGELRTFRARLTEGVKERLDLLYAGFSEMRTAGLPAFAVEPQGAIYLSVKLGLVGKHVRGTTLRTNEDVRELILREAGFGIVPFQAFGLQEESGWFRISVGSVSVEDIRDALPRVRAVVEEAAGA